MGEGPPRGMLTREAQADTPKGLCPRETNAGHRQGPQTQTLAQASTQISEQVSPQSAMLPDTWPQRSATVQRTAFTYKGLDSACC